VLVILAAVNGDEYDEDRMKHGNIKNEMEYALLVMCAHFFQFILLTLLPSVLLSGIGKSIRLVKIE